MKRYRDVLKKLTGLKQLEEKRNLCPKQYRHHQRNVGGFPCCSAGPCPKCCSREFAIHFCTTCTDNRGYFHPQLHVKCIRESARRKSGKCRKCAMILACLEQCATSDPNSIFWVQIRTRCVLSLEEDESTGKLDNKSLLVRVRGRIGRMTTENVEIYTLPNTTSPWPDIGAATELSLDSSSKESLEQARSWLADCCKNHTRCGSPTDHRHPLPTRLIDVMDGQKGAPVRLIETSIGQRGRYICLSHCWGDPKYHPRPLETNYESLKRHREEIPWESLPKTFQDAVSFVRLLGESYIWIDSLCIVQDCSEDWRQEASKMADIYMNSYLTLAATKSNDSTEGLFSMSDDKYKPYPYEVEENGSTYTVHYRKSLSHFFDKLDDRLEPTPLLQRAWAYQERLLSPRTLHFGNQELLWECKESTTCQCGVQFREWGQTCPKLDVLCRYGFYSRLWHRVVEDYSVLQLTKESDRLPAIAGIAKRVQSLRGSEDYLAGLWRGSLLEDLQWRRYSKLGDISLGRRDRSVAPSWSWVWIKGTGVEFDSFIDISDRVAYLVDAKVQSDQHDVFIKVSSGSITIKSYLFTARKPENSLPPVTFTLEPPFPGAVAFSNKCSHRSNIHRGEINFQSLKKDNPTDVSLETKRPVYYPDESGGPVYELPGDPWIHYLWTHTVSEGRINYFLALRPKEDRCAFERIGVLQVSFTLNFAHRTFQQGQMQTITIV